MIDLNRDDHDKVVPPVRRGSGTMVITSPYTYSRYRNGRIEKHLAVDLRTVRFNVDKGYVRQWGLQDIVATEYSRILRIGTDRSNNDFIIIQPLYNNHYDEIGYVHVDVMLEKKPGDLLFPGEFIGKSQIKGSSIRHHLHFFITHNGEPINPCVYFYENKIDFKYKKLKRT
jgi:hypothetical protein